MQRRRIVISASSLPIFYALQLLSRVLCNFARVSFDLRELYLKVKSNRKFLPTLNMTDDFLPFRYEKYFYPESRNFIILRNTSLYI